MKTLLSPIFVSLDLAITVLSFGFFHASRSFDASKISDYLLFSNGYSFFTNPIDLLPLAGLRSIFLLAAAFRLQPKARKLTTPLIVTLLLCYSYTLLKLLGFADIPDQLDYPGVWILIPWSLFSTGFVVIFWFYYVVYKTDAEAQLAYDNLQEEDSSESDDSTEDSEENDNDDIEEADKLKLPTSKVIKLLYGYAAAHKFWFILGFSFATLFALSIVLIPLLVGQVIADITRTHSLDTVVKAGLQMTALAIGVTIFSGLRGCFIDYATANVYTHIRADLFAKLLSQEIGFFDSNRSGALLSRLSSDCETMASSITMNINIFLRNSVTMIGALAVMSQLSWRLTTISFVVIPFNGIMIYIFGTYFDKLSEKRQKAVSKTNQVAEEVISNMRTVRSFACEEQEIARFKLKLNETLLISRKRSIAFIGYYASSEACDNLMLIMVVTYGGYLAITGKLASELLVTFILYQMQLEDSIYGITDMFSGIMESVGASRKVFAYLNRDTEIANDGKLNPAVSGNLELKDVHFAYPTRPNQPVLKGLNLSFNAGETVALVGPSGGGKSSIVSLIEHFYEPQEGSILLDGIPIQDIAHDYYHQKIALVAQEPVLYDGSVRYNITYGCEWATEENMLNAAKMANVHSFVMEMEKGYDTKCGEKGVQMSGGQKQRIAIARALVRNPAVLILDEATSALDTESEALVQDAINRCCKNRTVIIIAHRLSTIEKADRIAVIQKGVIQQIGSHQELMKDSEGLYHTLVSKQLLFSTVA